MRHLLRLAIATPLLALITCLEPTEVRIAIWTDICELHDVELFLGDGAASIARKDVASMACAPGDFPERYVGDIVFIPAKPNERRFTLTVRGERNGGMCPATGCVVATRNIAYLDHTALALRIDLDHDCLDVPCDKGFTCVHGVCQNDRVDCTDKTCSDGGTTPDATIKPDAVGVPDVVSEFQELDVATLCATPKRYVLMGNPAFYWDMDGPNPNTIVEKNTLVQTSVVAGNVVSSANAVAGCGNTLSISKPQPLNPKQAGKGIGIAAWLWAAPPAGFTQILHKNPNNGMAGISVNVTMGSQLQIVSTDATGTVSVWTGGSLKANQWHGIEIAIPSQGTISLYIDGTPQNGLGGGNMGAAGAGDLQLGPAFGYEIDELRIFDLP